MYAYKLIPLPHGLWLKLILDNEIVNIWCLGLDLTLFDPMGRPANSKKCFLSFFQKSFCETA